MGSRIAGYIAVGDVHGSLGALDQVIRACAEYRDHRFVFLGDYIDGGPESDGVVSRLRSVDGVYLIGNHEISLIRARTRAPGKIVPDHEYRLPEISAANFEWLRNHIQLWHETPDYIFVHAGLDPGRPLAEQTESDLLWSRYDGEYAEFAPKRVVHGHTRVGSVQQVGNRVNINTSAGYGGPLTALVLPEWIVVQSDPTPGHSKADTVEQMKRELEELQRNDPPRE